MKHFSAIKYILLLVLALLLPACGGGGGNGPTTQAVVSFSLSGSDSSPAGSVQFDLRLPDGFTLATDGSGHLADNVLTPQVSGSTIASNYQPETTLAYGQVNIAQITADINGLPNGVILTLTRTLSEGETLPAATEFTISNLEITDGTNVLNGYNVTLAIEQRVVY